MTETAAKLPGTVVVSLRLRPDVVARVDSARGTVTRSDWLEQAVLTFLDAGAVLTSLEPDPGRTAALRAALRGSEELRERLRQAQSRPLPSVCAHRKRGAYCVHCRSLIDPDGFPVRAP